MNDNTRHPFAKIAGYNNLSMLESLIPFVDNSLKLPLALFIKISELQLIIRTLQNPEDVLRYGLHNTNHRPSDLLGALTGISPELIDLLLFQGDSTSSLNNLFGSLTGNVNSEDGLDSLFSSNNTPDFSDNMESIDSLFAAYDQQQNNTKENESKKV